jgi:hypothetical protein
VFPELVSTDNSGYKSIDYTKLTPVMIEAIKDLKSENDLLKSELAKMKAMLTMLMEEK